MKERRWHVSEIENILKENQKIYDANQRKLNSLQLELVKSDNATWLHFFWGQSYLSKSQLVWILMIAITLQIKKCYSRLNQCRLMHTKWGHIFDAICTIRVIIDNTKLCKLARLEWSDWIFICHAINSITGQSMDVKIIVATRPRETSWLIQDYKWAPSYPYH